VTFSLQSASEIIGKVVATNTNPKNPSSAQLFNKKVNSRDMKDSM
jgi:hypothetical protein